MKKLIMLSMMLFACFTIVNAQQKAQIKFDKITHDFGKFNESTPEQKCVFTSLTWVTLRLSSIKLWQAVVALCQLTPKLLYNQERKVR